VIRTWSVRRDIERDRHRAACRRRQRVDLVLRAVRRSGGNVRATRSGAVLGTPVLTRVRVAGAGVAAPYEYVTSSLAGPVPAAPPAIRIQTSNECVVALPKFFTPAQSTMIHELEPSESTAIRIAPAPPADGLRSVQSGASTLFGRAGFGKCCGVKTMSLSFHRRARGSRSTRHRAACRARHRSRTSAR